MQTQKQVSQETSRLVSWSVRREENQPPPRAFCWLIKTTLVLAPRLENAVRRPRGVWLNTPTSLRRRSPNWGNPPIRAAPSMRKPKPVRRWGGGSSSAGECGVKVSSVQMKLSRMSASDFSPSEEVCCWEGGRLELRAGRWFGGRHDLHVLGEDGLEGLVSVDHGAKHQRLLSGRSGYRDSHSTSW